MAARCRRVRAIGLGRWVGFRHQAQKVFSKCSISRDDHASLCQPRVTQGRLAYKSSTSPAGVEAWLEVTGVERGVGVAAGSVKASGGFPLSPPRFLRAGMGFRSTLSILSC